VQSKDAATPVTISYIGDLGSTVSSPAGYGALVLDGTLDGFTIIILSTRDALPDTLMVFMLAY